MQTVRVLALVWVSAWGGGAAAQQPTWSLTAGQAAVYDRTHDREIEALEPPAGADDRAPNSSALPPSHNGGVLFGAELDGKHRTPLEEPRDLCGVLPRIAFDLRTFKRGHVREALPLVTPFGTLLVSGAADKPDADGSQELRLDLRREAPPDKGPGAPPFGRVGPFAHDLTATLILQRTFDAERGLVARFDATLEGTLTLPAGQPWTKLRFRIRESWRLRELFEADTPRFRERVGLAIQRGLDAIEDGMIDRTRRLSDTPAPEEAAHAVDHLAGELALAVLTAVKAGARRDSQAVRDAYDALRTRPLRDTYTLGVTLMAFDALYADPNERDNLVRGLLDAPRPRTPSDADRDLMSGWVQRLLDNRDTRVDRGYTSRWTYTGGESFDNSNTQYALLGLYSAQLCGVDVPTTVWWGAGRHFVDQQCPPEGPVALSLTTQRQIETDRGGSRTTTRVDARGWSYTYANEPAYGSMTTAGIGSLTICLAGLRDAGVRRGQQLGEFHAAIRQGWAWLAKNYRVRGNAGDPTRHDYWRYYYLYGLERACELSQIARIGDRDWYFEGASLLLEMQAESGHFQNAGFVDDCFAILFLKKASMPVFTGR